LWETDRQIQNTINDLNTGRYEEENEQSRTHLKKSRGKF
jgi:hypothetical protein